MSGKMQWDLEDSLKLVRAVGEEIKAFGYEVTLGGSVLQKGSSERNIDLFLFPIEKGSIPRDRDALIEWLKKTWGYYEGIEADNDGGPYYIPPPPPPDAPPAFIRGGGRVAPRGVLVEEQLWGAPIQENWAVKPIEPKPAKKAGKSIFQCKFSFTRKGGDTIHTFIV